MMIKTVNLGELISPAKVRRCNDGEYPVLSMTMHDGIVLQSERFKKSLASLDQSNYKVVSRGQLVVGFPIDEGVIYVQNAADEGIMSPAYGVWDIQAEKVLPEYLECCLHSPQSMSYYMSKLKGTTARRRSITTEDLLSLPISLPDKSEQRRRLSLLLHCKDIIAKTEQQLAKLDELVKSRFIEMFGDPVASENKKKLSEIGRVFTGNTPSMKEPSYYESNDIPFIKPSDLNENGVTSIDDVEAFVSEKSRLVARIIPPNSVLVTCIGTIGKIGITTRESCCNQQINFIVPNDGINSVYLAYCLTFFKSTLQNIANAPVVPIINKTQFSELQIPVFEMDMQQRFATFVEQTDKSKLVVQQSLEKLETLKKSLMQQYFG